MSQNDFWFIWSEPSIGTYPSDNKALDPQILLYPYAFLKIALED